MTQIFIKGKPFTPPVVHGVTFTQIPDRPDVWTGNAPDAVLKYFHVNEPGSIYWTEENGQKTVVPKPPLKGAATKPSWEVAVENFLKLAGSSLLELGKEEIMKIASDINLKADLIAWAEKELGLIFDALSSRDHILKMIWDFLLAVEAARASKGN